MLPVRPPKLPWPQALTDIATNANTTRTKPRLLFISPPVVQTWLAKTIGHNPGTASVISGCRAFVPTTSLFINLSWVCRGKSPRRETTLAVATKTGLLYASDWSFHDVLEATLKQEFRKRR